jgi:hypothetical protein
VHQTRLAAIAALAFALMAGACSNGGSTTQAPPASAPAATPPAPASSEPAKSAPAETPKAGAQPAAPAQTAAKTLAPENAAAEKPAMREVTVPAGTTISVRLSSALASDTSRVEDRVRGTISKAILVDGATAVPAGAAITGSVLDAKESGRVKGRASIAFRFDRLTIGDEALPITTARIEREAAADRKDDIKKGAIGGGAGAIVGGIIGGGKGAAIGAAIGGTGAVVATKGKEIQLPAGTIVTTTLQDDVKVVVAGSR